MNELKLIGSINQGNEFVFIEDYFKKNNRSIIYIARDDKEIFQLSKKLEWILPEVKLLLFRSWDQIPYDNVSPSKEIQSERIKTLFEILNTNDNHIIITSVNAIIQKTVNKEFVKNNLIEVHEDKFIQFQELINKINSLGYQRTSLVREKSEYSIRGSIIDIFISDRENPIRLDFVDDKIDKIFEFDKVSQKKIKKLNKKIIINPSSELLLNKNTLNSFRQNFRNIFIDYRKSQFYKLFSELITPPGGENYLPLFYESTSTLFDFCKNHSIIINSDFNILLETRLENIKDFYNVRIENNEKFHLPLNYLFLNNSEIKNYLNKKHNIQLHSYFISENNNFNIKKINNLSSIKKEIDFKFIYKFFEINKNKKIIICSRTYGSCQRLKEILLRNLNLNFEIIDKINIANDVNYYITVLNIDESIEINNCIFLNEITLLGYNLSISKTSKKDKDVFLEEINKFSKNSILVHSDYGFCKFNDIKKIKINNSHHDCLELEFANNQKLLLPIENLNLLTKYGNDDSRNISLDYLGTSHWQKRKSEAKDRIKDIAKKLISIAAKRHNSKSYKIDFNQNLYEKFSSTFPYVETDDQLKTIEDIKKDFSKSIPSDRLIVGDVAFGKTEVIIRAVFIASKSNIQSLILVPTTLLSRQHFNNFSNRLNSFGIKVKEFSRFVTNKEKNNIINDLNNGKIDVLIGTHALLNDKINFSKLGLIIYDEEQKLGTQQKEKFKLKAPRAHVISLSATPIPRTLSLSLSGIRDLSLILTAPYERLSVRTYISPFNEITIIEAIKREIYGRKNSVFYVTPRKKDIPFLEKFIKEKLPKTKYVVAHGKLKTNILEERITKFYNKEVPLLISTNIIENGLDLPHVNTIIVNRSNIFSLSSLYQLKGRVGRSSQRGYAYLTYSDKDLTQNAKKRLNIINSYEQIGSGFNIASQDLNIRGSGSIIGEEQSGFIKEVGVELYHQMLEEEIDSQNKKNNLANKVNKKINFNPNIKISEEIFIPDNYINDLDVKMSIYKRISLISNDEENNNLISELIDRFGKLPKEVENLFKLIEIKILCLKSNIEQIEYGRRGVLFSFYKNLPLNRSKIIKISLTNKKIFIRPDNKIFYDFEGKIEVDKFQLIKKIINYIN